MRIRLGTRGSLLARWQAEHVKGRLEALGHEVALHFISTTGDRTPGPLEAVGGKGAFLKEIEEALLAGEVDLAVHSLKDVPTTPPPGLALAAVLERADPRDALVSGGVSLGALPPGARLGTTSLRRRALLRRHRPDLRVVDLRGNVDTRLRRRREGDFEAVVLAMAGLLRLGRQAEVSEPLDPMRFIPAPGQGAIGLETREHDRALHEAIRTLHHEPTARAVSAERTLLAALGGGCNVPLGAFARPLRGDGARNEDDPPPSVESAGAGSLELVSFVASSEGDAFAEARGVGVDPIALGRQVAGALQAQGIASVS